MIFFRFIFCLFHFWVVDGSKNMLSLISTKNDDFCITNSVSAMYSTTTKKDVTTEETSFLPPLNYFCDFESNKCLDDYKKGPWDIGYSLYNEPLLDLRWERLSSQHLPFKKKNTLQFLTLAQLYDRDHFKIPISLLGKQVHLLLCDKEDAANANCYWFALQGWNSLYTAMRRCNRGEITGLYPDGECEGRMIEKKHPDDLPLFLSDRKWGHIILERHENNLYLKIQDGGQQTTVIHHSEKKEMFKLNFLLGHRKDGSVDCKVHENHYMRSTRVSEVIFDHGFNKVDNGICISLLLNTCPNCLTTVSVLAENYETILQKSFKSTLGAWKEQKISLNYSSSQFMQVEMKTTLSDDYPPTGQEYWYFDNIRECHEEEYRVTSKMAQVKLSECILLIDGQIAKSEDVTDYIPDERCPSNSIGSQCISCSILQQRDRKFCKSMKICEGKENFNTCYCQAGYEGIDCEAECPSGSYGYQCHETCGFCNPADKCNVVDGSCICNALFEGQTCKIPKEDHYLKNAPRVTSSTAQSCEIQWDSNDFIGKTKPNYYQIQYTDFRPILWKDYGSVEIIGSMDKAVIKNLNRLKKYAIRVLISDEETKIKKLYFNNLPYTICNTTCNGWNEDNIDIKTTTTTVQITIKLRDDQCGINSYSWNLRNIQDEFVVGGNSFPIYITNLDPYTNYTIVMMSSSTNVSKIFRTLEGVPSEVRNIELEEATETHMKIKWDVPEHPNGEIERYKVEYQKTHRVSCTSYSWSQSAEMNTSVNSIELNDLQPYTEYKITIVAVNDKFEGVKASSKLETQGLNFFKDEENLSLIKVLYETSEVAASFTFQNVQCENLLGPLIISIRCRCISDWCLSRKEQSGNISILQGKLNLRGLQPYSKYQTDISICRKQNCKIIGNTTLETKASVPNELKDVIVIAVGKTFIWLRWSPPYPPTGKTQIYRITTKCGNCYTDNKNIDTFHGTKCYIWPEYICYKIEKKIFYNYIFSVMIEAANEENYIYKQIALLPEILVLEAPPEKPYNFSVNIRTNNKLELSWTHPNRTNGLLEYFAIGINNLNFTYNPPKWQLRYNYEIKDSLPPAINISVRVFAVNNKYYSGPAIIQESSYPVSPDLVDPHIEIMSNTKTTISISMNVNQKKSSSSYVGKYLFVLIDDQLADAEDPNLEILKKKIQLTFETKSKYRIVGAMNLKKLPTDTFDFTIGDGSEMKNTIMFKHKILNEPLKEAQYYNINIIIMNEFRKKYSYRIYNTTFLTLGDPTMTTPPNTGVTEKKSVEEDNSSGWNFAYALVLLLIMVPIIIFVIMKRRNIVFIRPTVSLEKIMDTSTNVSPQSKDSEETIPLDAKEIVVLPEKPVMKVKPKLSIRKSTNPPNCPTELYSKPIKMADFEEYVKSSIESGELERQHALFPRGQTQPWTYGSSKLNKPKNRYNNLVAYDHSRVILEKIDGDESSDYINANYIHGYNMDRAYIATQGPRTTTLIDFWRMIWQENVKYIVMLANIYEGGKKKVEQYWPNINEELTFRDIVVQYQSMELFANFEYRVFLATSGNETRKIEQLHFTTWPDHGVPLYPQSLVPFLRKLLKIPLSSTSPIVVHCSAGVGRTGTILLADISLRMAAKQGNVDMLNNLQKLREQRSNMVDNIEQYKLAHLVVLECLMGLRTSILCDEDMDKNVQKLIRDRDYKIQMNYLKETEWQDQAMKSIADVSEDLPIYPEKNRIPGIVPENQGRIFISRYPHDDESSSYINAVQVDGFRSPGRFLVTQQPMPSTLGDFWRLVAERKINVIISLNEIDPNNETCCKFWPTTDNPELQPVDYIQVKCSNVIELQYYDIYSLHVWIKSNRQKEKLDVEIVALKHWSPESMLPRSSEELLSFYEEADAISRRSTNVIVTCFDGATASGVYVALSFLIEQMKLEHECDVCLAVRTIRHNRKQFVTDESQFLFLYDCAVKYINGFQSYANFQNQ